jgi:hypothetical protein
MSAPVCRKLHYAFIPVLIIFWGCQGKYGHGRLGRDTSAIESLVTIRIQQKEFMSSESRYGTLHELANKGLIPREYASGKSISGYIYSATDVSSATYCIQATRESSDAGYSDYNVTETGNIYKRRSDIVGKLKRGEGKPILASNID